MPRPRRDKAASAAQELAAVKGADRAARDGTKAATKKSRGIGGKGAHPVRAAKSAARKASGKAAKRR